MTPNLGRRCRWVLPGLLALLAGVVHGQSPPSPFSQPPGNVTGRPAPAGADFSLELPSRAGLFRVESEATALGRLRDESRRRGVTRVLFPEDEPLAAAPPQPDGRPPLAAVVPSGRVCYHTLYFEDARVERWGQALPCLEPVRSTGLFYLRAGLFPVRLLWTPPWLWECSPEAAHFTTPGPPLPVSTLPSHPPTRQPPGQ